MTATEDWRAAAWVAWAAAAKSAAAEAAEAITRMSDKLLELLADAT